MSGKTTYIYCKECRKLTEKYKEKCSFCEAPMQQRQEVNAPYVAPFRSGYYEHIDLEPIYIGSRKQLRQETEARGLTSHYIH